MEVNKTSIKKGTDPLSMIKGKRVKKQTPSPNEPSSTASPSQKEKGHYKQNSSSLIEILDEEKSPQKISSSNAEEFRQSSQYKDSDVNIILSDDSDSNSRKPNLENKHSANSLKMVKEYYSSIKKQEEQLFVPEEAILECAQAFFFKESKEYLGKLFLTEYQLIFQLNDFYKYKNKKKSQILSNNFKTYFFNITKTEKTSDKSLVAEKYSLTVTLNSGLQWKFIILAKEYKFYTELLNKIYIRDYSQYFKFCKSFNKTAKDRIKILNKGSKEEIVDGWSIYKMEEEFKRQGISSFSDKVVFSKLNADFSLCKTYPQALYLTTDTEDIIRDCSTFRTKNRLPALTYVNSNKCKGSLWRSSQPKSGITNNRNKNDEKVLRSIRSISGSLIIYDARPYLNAQANRVKGGGTEIVQNYDSVKLIFCEIDNIHGVSDSYLKLFQMNKNEDNLKYYSQLESTGWFEFTHKLLKYSKEIVKLFSNDTAVLIHCSDGWDRSSQLLAISQLLMDPYFRKGVGFCKLVEKEFVSFGHQFGLRSGIKTSQQEEDQKSPVFVQFLDCVFQLLHQFPEAFEFNESLLLFIAEHFHSLIYGTFVFNSECHRKDNKAHIISRSIWSDVFDINSDYSELFQNEKQILKPQYYNQLYNPYKYMNEPSSKYSFKKDKEILFPDHSVRALVVWEKYFYVPSTITDKILKGQYFAELMEVPGTNDLAQTETKEEEEEIVCTKSPSKQTLDLYITHSCFSLGSATTKESCIEEEPIVLDKVESLENNDTQKKLGFNDLSINTLSIEI